MKLKILQQKHTVEDEEIISIHTYIQAEPRGPFLRLGSDIHSPLYTLEGMYRHYMGILMQSDLPKAKEYSPDSRNEFFLDLQTAVKSSGWQPAWHLAQHVCEDFFEEPSESEFGEWTEYEYDLPEVVNPNPPESAGTAHGKLTEK